MLKDFAFQKPIGKEAYKQKADVLKENLAGIQQKIKEKKLPVIILFEGFSGAGKGNRIADTIAPLDPRYFKVHSMIDPDQTEKRMPMMWRYWSKIPAEGQIAIFDRSWYQEIANAQVEQQLSGERADLRLQNIRTFERQLVDNGYLILKFFLHITQQEQKRRLKKLEEKDTTRWRVTKKDKKRNKNFAKYLDAAEQMLLRTDYDFAPWHIVDGMDKRNAMLDIFETITTGINDAIDRKALPMGTAKLQTFQMVKRPLLKDISLDKTIDPTLYKELLDKYQKKLHKLHNELYMKKVPVVIAFEGWDASGKGGNIKRVAGALDPRGCNVNPIASPSSVELAHHYLWRFWNQLPKNGHIAIFDRTWYGRVMVERIEGFCQEQDWKRAYQEINEFEKELHDWGAIVVKFWMHIDQEEQLKRFESRKNNPAKRWKITDEDWRNREKWPQYEKAVDQMIAETSTDFAPWYIIEGNDKLYGRMQTLQILIDRIEDGLKHK